MSAIRQTRPERVPLDEMRRAHEILGRWRYRGKLVIVPSSVAEERGGDFTEG